MAKRRKDDKNMKGFLKGFIVIVFCAVFLYIFYNHMRKVFYQSPAFRIVEVVRVPGIEFLQSRYLDRLHGQNIFSVDVKTVERLVKAEYPALDHVRIGRRLPNRIIVMAHKRDPFVRVSWNRQDIAVDEFGMVVGIDASEKSKLPYLTGMTDILIASPGRPLSGQRITTGIAIIKAVRANEALRKFPIHSIDLTNLSQIHLRLNTLEIVMERFDIEKKINALGLLLSDPGIAAEQINYIDLRFKDPVVKRK